MFIDTNPKKVYIVLRINLNFGEHNVLKQYCDNFNIAADKFQKQSPGGVHLQKR